MPTPIKKVCAHCGSTDVLADAWAEWNERAQCWELASTFQDGWCNKCAGEARFVDKPLAQRKARRS